MAVTLYFVSSSAENHFTHHCKTPNSRHMCPRHGTCGLMKLTFGISETQYVSDCGLTYNGRVLTNNEVNLCRGGPLSTWMGDRVRVQFAFTCVCRCVTSHPGQLSLVVVIVAVLYSPTTNRYITDTCKTNNNIKHIWQVATEALVLSQLATYN